MIKTREMICDNFQCDDSRMKKGFGEPAINYLNYDYQTFDNYFFDN